MIQKLPLPSFSDTSLPLEAMHYKYDSFSPQWLLKGETEININDWYSCALLILRAPISSPLHSFLGHMPIFTVSYSSYLVLSQRLESLDITFAENNEHLSTFWVPTAFSKVFGGSFLIHMLVDHTDKVGVWLAQVQAQSQGPEFVTGPSIPLFSSSLGKYLLS